MGGVGGQTWVGGHTQGAHVRVVGGEGGWAVPVIPSPDLWLVLRHLHCWRLVVRGQRRGVGWVGGGYGGGRRP